MKATINGYVVEGTPQEISEFIAIENKRRAVNSIPDEIQYAPSVRIEEQPNHGTITFKARGDEKAKLWTRSTDDSRISAKRWTGLKRAWKSSMS